METFFKTLRPRQDGYHFVDNILKCNSFNEKKNYFYKFSRKFVLKCQINNCHGSPTLVQIMTWHRQGIVQATNPYLHQWWLASIYIYICVTEPWRLSLLLCFIFPSYLISVITALRALSHSKYLPYRKTHINYVSSHPYKLLFLCPVIMNSNVMKSTDKTKSNWTDSMTTTKCFWKNILSFKYISSRSKWYAISILHIMTKAQGLKNNRL